VSPRSSRRRSAPLLAWLAVAGIVAIILAFALLGRWSWQQAGQVQALQREAITLRSDYQSALERIGALRATASALQQQLASSSQASGDSTQSNSGTTTPAGQLGELQSSLEQLDSRVDDIEAGLGEATRRLQSLEEAADVAADPLPPEAHLSVLPQQQSHNLSCESSSAAMVAQYYGVPLTEAQVLASLPRADNPHLGFRGNVDGPPGGIQDYGVYAGPILDILNAHGLRAWLVEGGLEAIKAAIARGHPVMAWITYNCQVSTPVTRTVEGQIVTLVPYQHAVVVTGYDGGGVWANDPWDGQADYYDTVDFGRALAYFGDMAIEVAAP
jgi:uncharacterized protein YvpB